MNPEQPQISVITDISANIFAVFIIILIVLLAAPRSPPPPPVPLEPIDVTRDLVATRRAPLSAAGLVDLLYERRRASPSLKLDLFSDRIAVSRPGEPPEEIPLRATTADTAAVTRLLTPIDAPIGLYVFDHRGYATALSALQGRAFRELSVPAALRSHQSGREDWRDGFRSLIDSATDQALFREDLGRLLASPDPSQIQQPATPIVSGGNGRSEGTPADPLEPTDLLSRLALWLQRALAAVGVGVGLGLIGLVEWRARRA